MNSFSPTRLWQPTYDYRFAGPYTFGLGLATYLCSKEIYIMEHEFYTGLSIAIMGVYAVKKLGPAAAKFLDSEVEVYHYRQNLSFLLE